MAAQRAGKRSPSGRTAWANLTWEALEGWADPGSLKRGKSYFRGGCVESLAMTSEGELLAWVRGSKRYAVRVAMSAQDDSQPLASLCSCPVGYACKHAVATVLAYLDAVAHERDIPIAEIDDPRLDAAEHDPQDDEGDRWLDDADDECEFQQPDVGRRAPKAQRGETAIRTFLAGKTHEQLVDLVLKLALRFPELESALRESALLTTAPIEKLVKAAGRELRKVTSEAVFYDHWNGSGNLPDYGPLRRLFERILEAGGANYLLDLGVELLRAGNQQIEGSPDEGETAAAISGCLNIVFDAVIQCGLDSAEKILFAIYVEAIDDFNLAEGSAKVLDKEWPQHDWSKVADILVKRLGRSAASQNQQSGARSALVQAAAEALEKAGREPELEEFLVEEAQASGDFHRLIERLLTGRRLEEAERWARQALARIPSGYFGYERFYLDQLCKVAELRGDWLTVAAHRAEDFFEAPSVGAFEQLAAAAEKAACAPAVRAGALHFLETGKRPKPATSARGAQGGTDWPIPRPDYFGAVEKRRAASPANPLRCAKFEPSYDVLLELAIAEHRPNDALIIYDRHFSRSQPRTTGWISPWQSCHDYSAAVAKCAAESHPGRAAEIYERLIANAVGQTGDHAYTSAVTYLRLLRPVLAGMKKEHQWHALVAAIRDQQKRKRKLLAMLDSLEGSTIVDQLRK